MKTSDAGRAFIKKWEGERLEAYDDGGGVWTIGVGHTRGVKKGQKITAAQSDALLKADLDGAEATVRSACTRTPTQPQFDAMTSLTFNIGAKGFRQSTVLKRFNAGDIAGAAQAFAMWNKDNGRVIQGLVNRRAAEATVFLSG